MTEHIRMRKSRSEHIAVFMVSILLLSVLSAIGPIEAEPGTKGNSAGEIDEGGIDFETASMEKDIEQLHEEVLEELREIMLRYETLQTRMQNILDILDYLRNEVRHGRLAGTDLEPFWNEYYYGKAQLDELASLLDETSIMKLKELLEDINNRLEEYSYEVRVTELEPGTRHPVGGVAAERERLLIRHSQAGSRIAVG